VITLLRQTQPAISVRTLCRWLDVSRSWYYARALPTVLADGEAAQEIALRDAIERIVLDFPGYG